MATKIRNFRRRGDDGDDEKDADTHVARKSKAAAAPTRKICALPVSSKPKKLLSFADDEGEEETPPTRITSKSSVSASQKQSSSHKMTASKDRLPPVASSTTSNVQPQAGTYTKEALLELQKNTRTLAKSTSSKTVHSTLEPRIILKGLLKPAKEEPISQNDDQSQELSTHEERGHIEREEEKSDGESQLELVRSGGSNDHSLFPDEETIKKIREKREWLRQSRTAVPDYISLDEGLDEVAIGGLSDDDTEFRTRIPMIGKKEKRTHGVFEDVENCSSVTFDVKGLKGSMGRYANSHVVVENSPDGANEEDEGDIWEAEQFRKGLGKRMDDGSAPSIVLASSPGAVMHNQHHQQSIAHGSLPSIGGAFGVSQGLDALSMSQQAEITRKALQDNFQRLKESHSRMVSSLTMTDENLSASLMNITALEKSQSDAGEKFIFMQKLRDFISVICEFLQHKAAYIEELEEQMQKLHEERALTILDRRSADNSDEIMEMEVAVKAAVTVFSEHGSSAAMLAAATAAAQAASAAAKEVANLPARLDEYGRDANQQKRMDMKRRAEARRRRKAQADSKRFSSSMEIDGADLKMEGESSTDESDSEAAAYVSNCDLLLQTADQIFSDAADEYSDLRVIKERFGRWKKEYSASYQDAYMALSLPAIFSPYVRLELLKWDPLYQAADFIDMKWHALLFNYGLPEDGGELSCDDADANLVPVLVERVAVPILHHEIALCWDMLSARETKNAVFGVNMVINYVSPSSEALAELLATIRARLSHAIANVMIPTWSALILKAVPGAAQVVAYRFGTSVRLLRNICLWKDILSLPVLEKLALDELLWVKILPHVRSMASNVHDSITRTERIVASLSGVWAGPSVTGDRRQKLQPLVDYVLSLGRILEKKYNPAVLDCDNSSLPRRLKKMLVELNEYDNARAIARAFGIKEAL